MTSPEPRPSTWETDDTAEEQAGCEADECLEDDTPAASPLPEEPPDMWTDYGSFPREPTAEEPPPSTPEGPGPRLSVEMQHDILRDMGYDLPASPESPELKEALEDFAKRAIEWDNPDPEGDPSYEELAHDNYIAARAALVALFDRQREANLELWSPRSFVAKLEAEVASLSSQLERLKAEQLTAEEARDCRLEHRQVCFAYDGGSCLCDDKVKNLRAKLRRLSQSDTGDTNG